MESQAKAQVNEIAADAAEEVSKQSTIDFPYTDLDNAVEVVKGIHAVGGTACDFDQLAAHLGVEAKGGGFRLRINGARTFGLITYERGGRMILTDLARQMVDPQQDRSARARAFLAVPLYQNVHDTFRGGPLPPTAGLNRAIIGMGVGAKVADKARQVMMRSAKQAGFLELSADRLTMPSIKESPGVSTSNERQGAEVGGGGDGGGGGSRSDLHPLIQGLLLTLPLPNTTWPAQDRMNWLVMANSIFKMIYPTGDGGDIEISIAQK